MVRHQRPAGALAAAASVLLVPISAVAAFADRRCGRRAATCRSAASPLLAARTSPDARAALSLPYALPYETAGHKDADGLWCTPGRNRPTPAGTPASASAPGRACVVATVLRRAQELGRRLTRGEAAPYAR